MHSMTQNWVASTIFSSREYNEVLFYLINLVMSSFWAEDRISFISLEKLIDTVIHWLP